MPRKPPRGEERLSQQRALGARIQHVLDELGWTRADGAKAIGFSSPSTLSNICNGYNCIDSLDLWAFASKSGWPYQYFVDPDYRLASRWPRTKLDWELLGGEGNKDRADVHWKIETILGPSPSN